MSMNFESPCHNPTIPYAVTDIDRTVKPVSFAILRSRVRSLGSQYDQVLRVTMQGT